MNRTPEQLAFREAVRSTTSSIVLIAVAGAGKTTSLLDAVSVTKGQVAIVAFNKTIADEISEKLKKAGYDWKKAQAGTCHSFGFRTLSKVVNPIKVDEKKVWTLVDGYFESNPLLVDNNTDALKGMVVKTVSFAKQSAIGVAGRAMSDDTLWYTILNHYDVNDSDEIEDKEIIDLSKIILAKSNNLTGIIDFDDMIYLPLVKNLKFWQYDVVMVDEAQDINIARRLLVARMTKKGGRVVAVGDPAQAIYGFTGADSESLENIKKEFGAKEYPLSVCFRCDKSIIAFAQQWNPMIQPHEAKAPGVLKSVTYDDFMKGEHDSESVMLCRNTKPLVETAFALIRMGKPVYVEGRDIGEGMKNLARRWKIKTIDALINRLNDYKEREKAKAVAKGHENRAQAVEDQVDTLMVIINRCLALKQTMVQDVVNQIDEIFKDTKGKAGCFVLSTIHKSKGREWKRVFWLDRKGTLPSQWARKEWQLQQENNLCYVAATRAEHELIEVTK